MADLVITAANVLPGSSAVIKEGTAGAAITAGQVVYADSATNTYKLADCNSATAAVRSPKGIALHAAASGQPIAILTSGLITIGATVAVGVPYFLSGTAGGIRPLADNVTGDYVTYLGIGKSTTQIDVKIHESGAAMA
jgi:fructose-specific component phosphotransferase system IIB-like protein